MLKCKEHTSTKNLNFTQIGKQRAHTVKKKKKIPYLLSSDSGFACLRVPGQQAAELTQMLSAPKML